MSSITDDQERRVFAGLCGMVVAKVQEKLPPAKRGVRALGPIQDRVEGVVRAAVDRAVAELLLEVEPEIELPAEPFSREGGMP